MITAPVFALVWLATSTDPQLELRVEPDAVVTGERASVVLRARAPGASLADLVLQVEAGDLDELTRAGDTISARWLLPLNLTPRRLAAGIVDLHSGRAAFAALAVSRRARLSVTSPAGTQVRVVMHGEVVALGTVPASGRLELSVLVRPGAGSVTLVEHHLDGELVKRERLQLGGHDVLRLWVIPDGEPGGLHLFTYRDSGTLPEEVAVSANAGGRALSLAAIGPGTWRSEANASAGEAISATARDGNQTATVVVAGELPRGGPGAVWGATLLAGYTTDFGSQGSPSLSLGGTYAPDWLPRGAALVLDVGVTTTARLEPEAKGLDGKAHKSFEALDWLVPITAGLQYERRSAAGLGVEAGAATGALVDVVDSRRTNPEGKVLESSTAEVAWSLLGWLGLRYGLGPGALLLQVRVSTTLSDIAARGEGLTLAGVMAGYRLELGL